jgi:putative phosphoesterase
MPDKNPMDGSARRRPITTIGVLSDTHGHLDDRLSEILDGTDLILHAGDMDRPETLKALKTIGTVIPVRGNMDHGNWSRKLKAEEYVEAGGILIYMIHDLSHIDIDPASADIGIVISGHTHRPSMTDKEGVLYLNPGSASYPRGGFRASVAMIEIRGRSVRCRHIEL